MITMMIIMVNMMMRYDGRPTIGDANDHHAYSCSLQGFVLKGFL